MASEVEIYNMALLALGADQVLAPDENSHGARLAKARFGDVRDAVLRAHPWNCAIARASLAALSAAPAWGFAYQYQLPQEPYCLRVLELERAEAAFKIEGRLILTDEGAPLKIAFLARNADTQSWDALLTQAVAARLAHEIAYPLTNNAALPERQWRKYLEVLAEARAIDAQEGSAEQVLVEDFLNSRL
jgi:hypothetical protein